MKSDIKNIEGVVADVCKIKVPADGLVFDTKTVKGERIKEDADYEGVRVNFFGFLEKSKIPMQIDIGFGDVIIPKPSTLIIRPFWIFRLRTFKVTRLKASWRRSLKPWSSWDS